MLEPFIDFEFHEIDARHLVAIACATYDPTSQQDLGFMLAMKKKGDFLERDWTTYGAVDAFANAMGSRSCWGSINIGRRCGGGLAFDQITGRKIPVPEWD